MPAATPPAPAARATGTPAIPRPAAPASTAAAATTAAAGGDAAVKGGGEAVSRLAAAQAKFDSGLYDQALADAKDMVAAAPTAASTPAARLLIGRILERQKRLDDAMAAYVELRASHKSAAEAAPATLALAELVIRSKQKDRDQSARALYDEVATGFPASAEAPIALVRRAALEERGRTRVMDQALGTSVPPEFQTYRTVVEKYRVHSGRGDRAREAGGSLRRPQALRASRPDLGVAGHQLPSEPARRAVARRGAVPRETQGRRTGTSGLCPRARRVAALFRRARAAPVGPRNQEPRTKHRLGQNPLFRASRVLEEDE